MVEAFDKFNCMLYYLLLSTPHGNVLFAITQKLNPYEYSFTALGDYETLPLISIFLLFIPSPPSLFIPLSHTFYSPVSENFFRLILLPSIIFVGLVESLDYRYLRHGKSNSLANERSNF